VIDEHVSSWPLNHRYGTPFSAYASVSVSREEHAMPEPSEPTGPGEGLDSGGESAAARRWRARRERETGQGDARDSGDRQERLDANPYVDGLKYACAGFAALGLITFVLQPALGLVLWSLAGLSLVGWMVVGAFLWQPPAGQPPAERAPE
jgi:hypothetical protein